MDGMVPLLEFQRGMKMQNLSKFGGNVAAAVSALALSMALFVGYFTPALSAPVPVLLA